MAKLIECVPNFSEGRKSEVVNAIADAIRKTQGCCLLDCDPGKSTNRTVYTFIGSPDDVVNGALAAAKIAYNLIDMSVHKGEHSRMGALDVCPFIPLKNATMDDCVRCANAFGKRLSQELVVPVYLYGYAAKDEKRKLLPSIRDGEYESLPRKLENPGWVPDYGPVTFVPSWGASVTGARNFIIVYNVNLLSTKEQAYRVALDLRESGRGSDLPGKLKNVQGIGCYLEEADIAQISTTITDYSVTPLHIVYEEAKKRAQEIKLPVTGSEIVGLVPLECMLQAAKYYMKKEELFILGEKAKVRLAINRLGLNSLATFDPDKRIIEYCVKDDAKDFPVSSLTLESFISAVGSRTPFPDGGSVSAVVAAMGAALGTMAGLMTYGKRHWESLDTVMRRNIPPMYDAMEELISLIDKDSKVFDRCVAASKLPKKTEQEKKKRKQAMQKRLVEATRVHLSVMATINKCWPCLLVLAKNCNIACASDIQVGVKCLETGAWGANQNVLINLKRMTNDSLRDKLRNEAEKALDVTMSNRKQALDFIQARL